ncbi:MAG: polysaccharide deacetylase family protein [Bacteroidales bacterium]|jgi:peptidoglycan/xylan/chitin deacetylase (PgdA/CDA1 family)|nr:polysaccharide deacetylase family protein [Bacteroidales bacterium]
MLNYRNLNILFFIAILTLIVVSNYYTVGILAYLILIAVYVLLIAIGAFSIRQNFYFTSLNSGNKSKKEIALTFDDGPHPKITPEVLNLLDDYAMKATFFCIGKQVDDHNEIVKEADKRGHIIGNHSYHHGHLFDLQSSVKMTHELNQTRNSIYHAIGKMTNLFRPPFGVTNPLLKIAVNNVNLISIGWSIRSFDTNRSQEYVISRLKRKTHPGAIILLHDTRDKVIPILKAFLPWLQENGYQVVSLEKLLHIKAYETI